VDSPAWVWESPSDDWNTGYGDPPRGARCERRVGATLTTVLVCLGALASAARGDDGSVVTVGGAVRLMKDHGNIRMRLGDPSERASLSIRSSWTAFRDEERCPRTPFLWASRTVPSATTVANARWTRFEVGWMASRSRASTCPASTNSTSIPTRHRGGPNVSRFGAGVSRTIRDRYTVGPTYYPVDGTAGFKYVLWTGASWKGTIGSAEITATLIGIRPEWITGTDPKLGWPGGTLRWSFRDFEPGSAGRLSRQRLAGVARAGTRPDSDDPETRRRGSGDAASTAPRLRANPRPFGAESPPRVGAWLPRPHAPSEQSCWSHGIRRQNSLALRSLRRYCKRLGAHQSVQGKGMACRAQARRAANRAASPILKAQVAAHMDGLAEMT